MLFRSLSAITAPEALAGFLKRIPFNSLEEMYAAIGYGGYTTQKAIHRVRDEIAAQHRAAAARTAEQSAAKPAEKPVQKSGRKVKSEKGIIVEGLDNCLVKFAKCCTPVPGDPIVGFITRGYGVSVHRQDCPNAHQDRQQENAGRWLAVSWGDDTHETYATDLEVISKDRDGLLTDISTVFSSTKTSIRGLNVKTTTDGFALFSVTAMVPDLERLSVIINRLTQIPGVIKVSRPAG